MPNDRPLAAKKEKPLSFMAKSFQLVNFPIALIIIFYMPQSIYGFFKYKNTNSIIFIALLVLAVIVYYCAFYFARWKLRGSFSVMFPVKFNLNVSWLFSMLSISYVVVMVYACITYTIPLVAALRGFSAYDLSNLRQLWLLPRTPWEVVLPYISLMLGYTIIPYIMATLYLNKSKWLLVCLVFFLISLMLNLQKGATFVAVLPLIIVCIWKHNYKNAVKYFLLAFCFILLTTFLASGGVRSYAMLYAPNNVPTASYDMPHAATTVLSASDTAWLKAEKVHQKNFVPSAVVPEYNVFYPLENRYIFLINRTVWIPYLTAYYWLNYKTDNMASGGAGLQAIHGLNLLTGKPYESLEKNVFVYMFTGQNDTGTGAANTVYFVDAFLKFGYGGVVVYSILLGFIVFRISISLDMALKAAACVPFYLLTFASLTSVLLSGGLLLLLILSFLKTNYEDSAAAHLI